MIVLREADSMTVEELYIHIKQLTPEEQATLRAALELEFGEDASAVIVAPPFAIESRDELEQMLIDGINSGNGIVFDRKSWDVMVDRAIQTSKAIR
jgi:hypothetical protein